MNLALVAWFGGAALASLGLAHLTDPDRPAPALDLVAVVFAIAAGVAYSVGIRNGFI